MSTFAQIPSPTVIEAWRDYSPQLADCTLDHLVNRIDAWVQYLPKYQRSAKDSKSRTVKGELTRDVLIAHYRGESVGDLVALHTTTPPDPAVYVHSMCKWCGLDHDNHDGSAVHHLPQAIQAWEETRDWGSLLLDSNGAGGYHNLLIFSDIRRSEEVFQFVNWWGEELPKKAECFPKQATVTAEGRGHYGNVLRLPGRHHTRDHWTKVWDGRGWLDGEDAIRLILANKGSARPFEDFIIPADEYTVQRQEARRASFSFAASDDAGPAPVETIRPALGALAEAGFVDDYDQWLGVGMALKGLGDPGFELWDEWSQAGVTYDRGTCESKWAGFGGDGGLTVKSIFHWALNQANWKRPNYNQIINERLASKMSKYNARRTERVSRNGDGGAGEDGADESVPGLRKRGGPTDPGLLAESFVGAVETPDGPTLRLWQENWWSWNGTHYAVVPKPEIEERIWSHIDRLFDDTARAGGPKPQATKTVVANATIGIRAGLRLPSDLDQPCWIGGGRPAWDDNAAIVPAKNGLVNLDTGELAPHTPGYFCPFALPYDYRGKDEPIPRLWTGILQTQWGDDKESRHALQEYFGYLLAFDTRLQKLLIVKGRPNSGKSVIKDVAELLVGPDNSIEVSPEMLAGPHGLQPLPGKLLATFSDIRTGDAGESARALQHLLRITTGDKVDVNPKGQAIYSTRLRARILMLCNLMPTFRDSTGAMARRILALQANTVIAPGDRDPDLLAKIREVEMPGILAWAMRGRDRLYARGHFHQPEKAAHLLDEFNRAANPLVTFIEDHCLLGDPADPACCVRAADVYQQYRAWAERAGMKPLIDNNFFQRLGDSLDGMGHKFTKKRASVKDEAGRYSGKGPTTYYGITLQ